MERTRLQKEVLEKAYNEAEWREVLIEYFGVSKLNEHPVAIPLPTNDLASGAFELASFYTQDERLVGVFRVELLPKAWIERNRVTLRDLLKAVYNNDVDGALIVFVQDQKWRFSYVSEIRTVDGEKKTEPKRYTYLFGAGETCRTAADRFDKLRGKPITLDDLYEAFSVEKLNKDFFKGYKDFNERFWNYLADDTKYNSLFLDNSQNIDEKAKKPIRDFSKKLLGRLVFLQFLQKKGWMGVPINNDQLEGGNWFNGDTQFLQNLFKARSGQNNFHSTVLKTLFFETLNTKRPKDLAPSLIGNNIKIPYLNGGLFDKDISYENQIDFPDHFFGDLFNFFEQYNFTIDENDPYENEVGIDPEMLGHIFENLLEENRERGAFYTPKEIVHFMCQESLIEYLKTHLSHDLDGDIESLVRKNTITNAFSDHLIAQKVNNLLKAVTICDPAIGSGAFPMGMLKELFNCRRLLYGHLQDNSSFDHAGVKKEIIQQNIYGVDIDPGAVDIARLRFWLALVVDEKEPQPLPNLDYKIMQGNSLLERFGWMDLSSLSKDINIDHNGQEDDLIFMGKKNQLEIGVEFSKKRQPIIVFDKAVRDKFNTLLDKYYDPDGWEKRTGQKVDKLVVKKQIDNIVEGELHNYILKSKTDISDNIEKQEKHWIQSGVAIHTVNQRSKEFKTYQENKRRLKEIDELENKLIELNHTEDKPYFLWHTYFKEVFDKQGFDIMIGNPPYIQLQKMGADADILKDAGYETFQRTGDIYCLFYELGHKLLKQNGNLIYITGSSWLRSNFGKTLRKFFIDNTNPLKLIDLSDSQVFQSATVLTTITQFEKAVNKNKLRGLRLSRRTQHHIKDLITHFEKSYTQFETLKDSSWTINDREKASIVSAIRDSGIKLSKWDIEINYGLKTGLNEAFIIDKTTRDQLISKDEKSIEIIKPVLRGRDLKRYSYTNSGLFLLYVPWHFPLNNDSSVKGASTEAEIHFKESFPAVYEHLFGFKDLLQKRNKAEVGLRYEWYALQRFGSAYSQNFEKAKILYPNMVKDISFTFDNSGFYTNQKCFIITGDKLKYLIGVLNSRLFKYAFEEDFPELQGNSREINKVVFENIPIRYPDRFEESIVSWLVEMILYLYDESKDRVVKHTPNQRVAANLEEVLDMVVYELYFADHMRNQELNVISFLENRILENPGSEAILDFYLWLQQPSNPVRNRILSIDIKSPELLSLINTTT